MRVIPVIQVVRALALTALCFCASSLAAGSSGSTTTDTVAPPAGNAHALLGAKSWGGAVDVHVSGPHELKLNGPDGSGHLGSTRLSSTLRVTFHFDRLIQSDEFSATWGGSAHWSVSEHEYYELGAKGRPIEWGPGEASGDATTKATFSINFPEETGKGPGYWSIDLGDPSIHYRSTISDIAGRTETWSGEGTTEALDALEEAGLGGRLPPGGYIHGVKVETQQSRLAETRARIKKDIPPSMESLKKSFEKMATIEFKHPVGPDSQMVMPKSAVHWTILADPCTGENRRIRVVHTVLSRKRIVFDRDGLDNSDMAQAGVAPEAYASMAEDLGWDFPAAAGLNVDVSRGITCNASNCVFDAEFKGMPSENSGYGHKKVSVYLPGFASCVKSASTKVTYFYSRDGTDNPQGRGKSHAPIPNWFHYWVQTAAASGHSPANIVYNGGDSSCVPKPGWIMGGYFSWTVSDSKVIHLCRGIVQTPWPNPITGRVTSGIDAFAITVMHEFAHKRHYHEWWITIDRAIAQSVHEGNTKRVNKLEAEKKAMDEDGDDIPDRLECHYRKDGTWVCPRWRGIYAGVFDSCGVSYGLGIPNQNKVAGKPELEASDEHCLIFRDVLPHWHLGAANKQDWSCPGKQSASLCNNGGRGESASRSSATAGSTASGMAGARSETRVRSVAQRNDSDPRSGHTAAGADTAPSGDAVRDPPAAPPPVATTRASALLQAPGALSQMRGMDVLERSARLRPDEKMHLLLPAFKRAVTNPATARVGFTTGFMPRRDWLRLQYLFHVAALGPKALSALRAARSKATGPYREYLTLALAAAGGKHPVRLLSPLVKKGSTWVIRREAVLLVGSRAGGRKRVQTLLKATLQDPAEVHWQSDVGGPTGHAKHLYPVRDAAALMLVRAGYNIKRTAGGGYTSVWTPAVPRLAGKAATAPNPATADGHHDPEHGPGL